MIAKFYALYSFYYNLLLISEDKLITANFFLLNEDKLAEGAPKLHTKSNSISIAILAAFRTFTLAFMSLFALGFTNELFE